MTVVAGALLAHVIEVLSTYQQKPKVNGWGQKPESNGIREQQRPSSSPKATGAFWPTSTIVGTIVLTEIQTE